jgi:hypothetical protein
MEVASHHMKLVQLPLSSGVRKDFHIWWIRFVAYANMCKFLAGLKTGGEASMPSSDSVIINTTTDAAKIMAAVKKRDLLALSNLRRAFETDNLFGLISQWGILLYVVTRGNYKTIIDVTTYSTKCV